jgi:hypothetical protein
VTAKSMMGSWMRHSRTSCWANSVSADCNVRQCKAKAGQTCTRDHNRDITTQLDGKSNRERLPRGGLPFFAGLRKIIRVGWAIGLC